MDETFGKERANIQEVEGGAERQVLMKRTDGQQSDELMFWD